jgi:ketosteroid isomerase-like protein
MSQQNVEIVRRAFGFEVHGYNDPAEAWTYFDRDLLWNPIEEELSYGPDAVRAYYERWGGSWQEHEVAAEEFIDAGDRVFVSALFRGRGRGSGASVEARFYGVYALRNGKIVRMDEYTVRAEALEAAGLRE